MAGRRWIANKFMKFQRVLNTEQDVEWLYAFDIHCNGFFPVFVLLGPVQFFLSPLLLKDNFMALLIGNTLYAFALCYYHYITFLGYTGKCDGEPSSPPAADVLLSLFTQRCRSCNTSRSFCTRLLWWPSRICCRSSCTSTLASTL